MACFAPPYGLRYAAHCFNRADAQNNRPALIPAGGKLGVTSLWMTDFGTKPSLPTRQLIDFFRRQQTLQPCTDSNVKKTRFGLANG